MSLHLAGNWPLFVGAVVLALAVGAVVLAYRRLGAATDRRGRRVFLTLRIAAAVLLVLLLLDPVLSRDRLQTESNTVVVLLDRSRSMSVPDSYRGRPRHQVAGAFLTDPDTGLRALLEDDLRVVTLAFDTRTREATPDEEAGRSAPAGRLTDLAGAMAAAADAVPRAETAAVVLLTDGAENAGGDAREEARRLGVPVFAVGFGSRAGTETARRDLIVAEVTAPETAFVGNTVVAEAAVRSTGYDLAEAGNRRVRVVLTEDDREVASEWIELTEEGVPVRVPLRFVPEGTGRKTYRVSVAVRGDESIPENNTRTFSVDVQAHRATVLYFDASLRWEAKFLRDFLARDPAVELTSVLHSGQGRLVVNGSTHGADLSHGLPATKEDLGKFDVVILGDVEAAAVGPGALEALRARVEEGGGLLTLGGYHAYGPGGYAGSPLAAALPVVIGKSDGQRETELSLTLTPEGRVHPVLSGLTSFFAAEEPPGLRGLTEVGRAKPGAQVLLESRDAHEPVLAVERYGEGRVAAFTGDTSWLWYRSPVHGGPDGVYGRFWGQVMRWLLEKEPEVTKAGEPVVLFTDRPVYRIGEVVRLRARVANKDGEPIPDASVSGHVRGPAGADAVALAPLPRVPGHYETRIRALDPGDFAADATAKRADATLGTATAKWTVEDQSVEMDAVDLDEERLTAIAAASGGRWYHAPPSAEEVARDLRASLAGLVRREETPLVSAPLFFLLFVGLLTAEWWLRRRRNLL